MKFDIFIFYHLRPNDFSCRQNNHIIELWLKRLDAASNKVLQLDSQGLQVPTLQLVVVDPYVPRKF